MTEKRPFIFRIHAAEFFSEVQKISDKERAAFLTQFSSDLITLTPALEYSKHVIQQTIDYIEKQSANGRLGGRPKKSDGLAAVKQPLSDAKATPKPNESHNKNKNKNKNNKQSLSLEEKSLKEIDLPEWFPKDSYLEFLAHRESLKKPMTELAVQKMIKYLDGVRGEYDIIMLLDRAIRSQWQSVYLSDDCKLQTVSKQPYC